jgi:hypothetical protein
MNNTQMNFSTRHPDRPANPHERRIAMRSLWKLTLALACTALMLAGPGSSFGAGIDFWVGFGSVQTKTSLQSKSMWVPVVIGNNETTSPQTYNVPMSIFATGPSGYQCNITTEVTGKFHPAITMPVQFQVVYSVKKPPLGTPGTSLKVLPQGPPVQYTVKAVIHTVQLGGVAVHEDVTTNNKHEIPFSFPAGGTPGCVRLSCPAGASCYPPSN